MRICVLADDTQTLDEGMSKTAFYLSQGLSKSHQVKALSPRRALSPGFWREMKEFQPQIIHYIPGPSILSFMLMKALQSFCHARTVISATHPAFYGWAGLTYGPYYALSSICQVLVPLLKPDRILVQSPEVETLFQKLGCHTEFLPGGVDIEKFIPVSLQRKQKLRQKYGLSGEKFIVLHCGSFRRWRNLGILSRLHGNGTRVLVVGNSSNVAKDIYDQLERNSCLVWKDYLTNIEEVYQLADCYVFPTLDRRGSIDLPLSVLEAMACNLPVVTTRFGALPLVFSEGDGFFFANNAEELLGGVISLADSRSPVRTREKVLPFSWPSTVQRLEEIYRDII